MSLESVFDLVAAACVHVPQLPVFVTEAKAGYQVKAKYGVNKTFWRTWKDLTLRWDCPSPPSIINLKWYEDFDNPSATDPVFWVGGFQATCAHAPAGLGTTRWFWMANLEVVQSGSPPYPIDYIHVQNYKTNAGSIGLIRYPLTPPV